MPFNCYKESQDVLTGTSGKQYSNLLSVDGETSPASRNHYPSSQRSWTLEPEVGSCIHSVLQSSLSFISRAGYQYVEWLSLSTPQAVLVGRKPPCPAPLLPVRFQPGFCTHFFRGSAFSDLTTASRDGAHTQTALYFTYKHE